jgi:hypothetical protein
VLATLTLDGDGMVGDCNRTSETLFQYHRHQMVQRHVSILLPQLANLDLLQHGRINPQLHYLCRIGHRFDAVRRDGVRFASELFPNLLDNKGCGRLALIVRSVV